MELLSGVKITANAGFPGTIYLYTGSEHAEMQQQTYLKHCYVSEKVKSAALCYIF